MLFCGAETYLVPEYCFFGCYASEFTYMQRLNAIKVLLDPKINLKTNAALLPHFSMKDDADNGAFDRQSASVIKLNNATVLYLKEVNRYLALVCILREDSYERQGK